LLNTEHDRAKAFRFSKKQHAISQRATAWDYDV
jgi:hypothetical protein